MPEDNIPNWYEYAARLPEGIPDAAYDAQREKYFDSVVKPWAYKQGSNVEHVRQQFMEQTPRKDKTDYPRIELGAASAARALIDPIAGATGQRDVQSYLKDYEEKKVTEAARQGINPTPYSMIGGMVGQLPYWYAGMELASVAAAAVVPEAAVATGVDLAAATAKLEQTRRLFNVAAGAAVEGSYRGAVAEDGHRMLEGSLGALEGGAFMVPFEYGGSLVKMLMGKHGVSEETAKALEASAKGVADEAQTAKAASAVEKDPSVVGTVAEAAQAAVKEGKKRGRPKKNPVAEPTQPGIQVGVDMTEAQLVAARKAAKPMVINLELPPAKVPEAAATVAKALDQGGSLENLNGDPQGVLNFLREVEAKQESLINNIAVEMRRESGAPSTPIVIADELKPIGEMGEAVAKQEGLGAIGESLPGEKTLSEELPANPLIESLRKVLENPKLTEAQKSASRVRMQRLSPQTLEEIDAQLAKPQGVEVSPPSTLREPPSGHTRLYRIENWKGEFEPEDEAAARAVGRWFTSSLEDLDYYKKEMKGLAEDANLEAEVPHITFVDVSNRELHSYQVKEGTEAAKFSGWQPGDPRLASEYFVSEELAKLRQDLPQVGPSLELAEAQAKSLAKRKAEGVGQPTGARLGEEDVSEFDHLEVLRSGKVRDKLSGRIYANADQALSAKGLKAPDRFATSSMSNYGNAFWVDREGAQHSVEEAGFDTHGDMARKKWGKPEWQLLESGYVRVRGQAVELTQKALSNKRALEKAVTIADEAGGGTAIFVDVQPEGKFATVTSDEIFNFVDNPEKFLKDRSGMRYAADQPENPARRTFLKQAGGTLATGALPKGALAPEEAGKLAAALKAAEGGNASARSLISTLLGEIGELVSTSPEGFVLKTFDGHQIFRTAEAAALSLKDELSGGVVGVLTSLANAAGAHKKLLIEELNRTPIAKLADVITSSVVEDPVELLELLPKGSQLQKLVDKLTDLSEEDYQAIVALSRQEAPITLKQFFDQKGSLESKLSTLLEKAHASRTATEAEYAQARTEFERKRLKEDRSGTVTPGMELQRTPEWELGPYGEGQFQRASKMRYAGKGASYEPDGYWVGPNGKATKVADHGEWAEAHFPDSDAGDSMFQAYRKGYARVYGEAVDVGAEHLNSRGFAEAINLATKQAKQSGSNEIYISIDQPQAAEPLVGKVELADIGEFLQNPIKYLKLNKFAAEEGAAPGAAPTKIAERPLLTRVTGQAAEEALPKRAAAGTYAPRGETPIIYYKNPNPTNMFHENIHGHIGNLGLTGLVDFAVRQHPTGSLMEPALPKGLYGQTWPEEAYAYAASAIRTKNDRILQPFIDADTDREHVLRWVAETSDELLRGIAERPESLHKLVAERRIREVLRRSTAEVNTLARDTVDVVGDSLGTREGAFVVGTRDGAEHVFTEREALDKFLEDRYGIPINVPQLVDEGLLPEGIARPQVSEAPHSLGRAPLTTTPPPLELHELINARDSLYHGTDMAAARQILKAGELTDNFSQSPVEGEGGFEGHGISTSRVPTTKRLYANYDYPITFVLDKKKVGKTTEFVGDEVRKFEPWEGKLIDEFEFEEKTKARQLPLEAVKGILVNEEALAAAGEARKLSSLLTAAKNQGIEVKVLKNFKEVFSYRAGLSQHEFKFAAEEGSQTLPKGGQITGGVQAFSNYFRPFYRWLATVAEKNEWPELYHTFKQLDYDRLRMDNFMEDYRRVYVDIFKGVSKARRSDFYRYMEANDKDKAVEQLRITPVEQGKLDRVRTEFFDPLFTEFGINAKMYIESYVPHIRDSNYDLNAMKSSSKFTPEEVDFFAEHYRTGELDPRETDLLRVMDTYLRLGSRKKFMESSLKAAAELNNLKTPEGSFVTGTLQPILQRQVEAVRGIPDHTGKLIDGAATAVQESINGFLEGYNKKAPKQLQIEPFESAPRDVMGKLILFQYAGGLALRPMVPIRDFLQTYITGFPILGGKYTAIGQMKAMQKGAWEIANKAGALVKEDNLKPLYSSGETGVGGTMTKAAELSLKPLQWSNNIGRLVSFWGHTERALDAMKTFRETGDVKKLVRDSAMTFLEAPLQQQFVREIQQGGADMAEPIAHRISKELVEVAHWNLRVGANPGIYKYTLGRLFGQYGTWPLNYIEYIRNIAANPDKQEAAKAMTRLAVAHGAILAAGQKLGVDTAQWVFTQPMAYGGGPLYQAVVNIPGTMDFETYKGQEARRAVIHPIFPGSIPGGVAAERLHRAIVSDDPELFKILLGFVPLKPNEENKFMHQIVP